MEKYYITSITSDVDITYLLLILFWIFQHKLSYNLFVFRGIKKLHASQWCFLQFYFRPFCLNGSDAGYVVFFNECCYINDENETICFRVEKNLWMKTIDVCTYIIIVLAMLYCPMLIPTSFYRQKYTPSS
jgi:hypothetical protein